jgi:DNA-binding Lrp family transcriptional regulator
VVSCILVNNKPAKRNDISDNSSKDNKNSDVSSQFNANTHIIDNLDQKLLELILKGYENKKIATEVQAPLSTIQRRIRKIFENQYISRKNEMNYKKLGLRKGYLMISLRGDKSYEVAQKLAGISSSIISIPEVTGSFDILCICIFRNTNELFNMMESIRAIERVDQVSWAEEVHSLETEEKQMSYNVKEV